MHRLLRRESGQMTIEAILIMSILTSLSLLIVRTARDQKYAAALVEKPWKPLQGMIEDGVWEDAGKSKANHPSLRRRHHSNRGDQVPRS